MKKSLNSSEETPISKPVFTLDFSYKGTPKSISISKNRTFAFCFATILLVSGSGFTFHNYLETKSELGMYEQELLQSNLKNKQLEQALSTQGTTTPLDEETLAQLQQKTLELEEKIVALEEIKDNLNNELNTISTTDPTSEQVHDAVASSLIVTAPQHAPLTIDFTPIVTTAYHQDEFLFEQLTHLDSQLQTTDVTFTSVAKDAIQTLSAYTDIPTGTPVPGGIISSPFNESGTEGRVHKGVDISTRSQPLSIFATALGTVEDVGYHSGYGNYIFINHGNGFTTFYAHNSENLVNIGDIVKKGDPIGITGSTGMSTGVHCHYEVKLNGMYQDPTNFF